MKVQSFSGINLELFSIYMAERNRRDCFRRDRQNIDNRLLRRDDDLQLKQLASRSGLILLSAGYSLIPENKTRPPTVANDSGKTDHVES